MEPSEKAYAIADEVVLGALGVGDAAQVIQRALDEARGDQVARKDRPMNTENWTFRLGDRVTKTKGSSWTGRVVGFYSTTLTPEGYAIESDTETGSVQIYPVGALKEVGDAD